MKQAHCKRKHLTTNEECMRGKEKDRKKKIGYK
jgi:hypothetical protein